MKEIYVNSIAEKVGAKVWQVENCVQIFDDGATIPFISRYRKERTGGLDAVAVAEIRHWVDVYEEMEKRKGTILETIEKAGALTDELKAQIENCIDGRDLEDLYLPYKPKRRTRATIAKEAGLEPLAVAIIDRTIENPLEEAGKYVCEAYGSAEEALAGARDIIAEKISETAIVRENQRKIFALRNVVCKTTKKAAEPEALKYKAYFKCIEPLRRIASHRLLAMLRAEKEGYITINLDPNAEKCGRKILYDFSIGKGRPSPEVREQLEISVADAFKRLLEPSISNEVMKEAKEKADRESIKIFGENLRQLLLAPPVGQKRTMAIDPGFRTGCKVVCLDAQGNLLEHDVIFPHPPSSQKIKAISTIGTMMDKYQIEVIAIGEGTAGRETEEFIDRVPKPNNVRVFTVNEDGASIYSASETGREEFPNEDVTVRGAVSIGRRLMDPLAELVKIDPKSLGVGQYQHDVDQGLLKEQLDNVVMMCVNSVGINLNTASPYLLSYVSGIGPTLARSITEHRKVHGPFKSRSELLKVKRLGAKVYEQCAGFLRIPEAENPLDNSAVHPESYHIVEKMAASLGVDTKELVGNEEMCDRIVAEDFVEGDFGLPTINDIIAELKKPGRDPRSEAVEFEFANDVRTIDDLEEGMELPGVVTNITDFGAFVDIGIHENGLIHVSRMGLKRGEPPTKAVKLRQNVKVQVVSVDLERLRVSLRLCR